MNSKGISKQLLTTDPRNYANAEVRVGPDTRGPSKCLKCHQVFKRGEVWQRIKSPPDPVLGSYYIGIHGKCPVAKPH